MNTGRTIKNVSDMNVFSKTINKISDLGAILSAVVFALMTILILSEVVLRTFFGSSTEVSGEYSGYALAALIYLGLGFSFREGAHIRITFLRERLGRTSYFILELLCTAFAMVLSGLSCIFIWEMVLTSKARNLVAYTPAETPLYIPQALILVGMIILTFQIIAQLAALIATGPQAVGISDSGAED